MQQLFDIIHEDSEFLVVHKPAGLVCHPTKTDEYSSLISRARLYLGQDIRPQLINRLDRETSGITLLAKNDDSARRLRQLWERRLVSKEYFAVVHGHVPQSHQVISAPLAKDEASLVAIKDCVRTDGAPSQTEFWLESTFTKIVPTAEVVTSARGHSCPQQPTHCNPLQDTVQAPGEVARFRAPESPPGSPPPTTHSARFSLLRVQPHTGRKHQIRIHLSHIGHPIVGDKLYGGDEDLYLALVENRLTEQQKARLILPYHALHAAQVRFEWASQQRVFNALPEPWFTAFCRAAPLA
jgi:23S rRNA pseudouridine1911/1915/1917 synthase